MTTVKVLRIAPVCAFAALWIAACGRLIGLEGAEEIPSDAGVAGTTADGGIECWSGQKWCNGECHDANDPKLGCGATSCEPCIVPNATAKCANGQCAIGQCSPGYTDCDKNDFVPSCEVDTQNDTFHCGGCVGDGAGEDCSSRGPAWICTLGLCVETACMPTTTGDCDGDKTNGCEVDLSTDVDNCGFCKHSCAFPNAQTQCIPDVQKIGACMITKCAPGWADCDGNALDGCEINTTSDTGNCGTCGNPCTAPPNALPICNSGSCDFQCSVPYAKCGGSCIDLATDVANCGGCGKQCQEPTGSVATCSGGTCSFACQAALTKCGSVCVDTQSNVNFCGSCSKLCTAPTGGMVSCVSGVCVKSCPGAQTICGNICVDTQTNSSNCGGCNNFCPITFVCVSGQCVCPQGKKDCGGKCQACCTNSECYGSTPCCFDGACAPC